MVLLHVISHTIESDLFVAVQTRPPAHPIENYTELLPRTGKHTELDGPLGSLHFHSAPQLFHSVAFRNCFMTLRMCGAAMEKRGWGFLFQQGKLPMPSLDLMLILIKTHLESKMNHQKLDG